jgi:hypothetical protein
MSPSKFQKRAATNAIAAQGGLYDRDPGMTATRAAGRWVAGEASSEALDRLRSPIYTAAQALCDSLYGFARSGIDPARLGLRGGADELDGGGGELHFGSSSTCLAGLLGWIDLYRRELATPRPTRARAAREIDSCLRNVRMVLADAPLGWREACEIGSGWSGPPENRRPIGLYRDHPDHTDVSDWLGLAANSLTVPVAHGDLGRRHARALVVFLIDLMEVLIPGRVERLFQRMALRWLDEFDAVTGCAALKSADIAEVRRRLEVSTWIEAACDQVAPDTMVIL